MWTVKQALVSETESGCYYELQIICPSFDFYQQVMKRKAKNQIKGDIFIYQTQIMDITKEFSSNLFCRSCTDFNLITQIKHFIYLKKAKLLWIELSFLIFYTIF